jgi:lipoprotein-anchoring transpeptidase ErfK/SrfK
LTRFPGTTIGIDVGSTKPLSEDQKRYKQAMAILSSEVPNKDGHSLVELYTVKQKAYTDAVSAKTRAFDEAMKIAQKDPSNKTSEEVRAAYDRWVQENARAYRNAVQASYMDWVIMGKKEEVEYWFSVVDQDSALARVEQSKVCFFSQSHFVK